MTCNLTATSARLTFAALLAIGSAAVAAPTAWDTPAGDQGGYTYSSGESANGHFGSGNTYSEGFYFLPSTMTALALGPGSNSTGDTLSVILNAKPNTMFTHIGSAVLGDYSIFGVGGVNSTGLLRVVNLDTLATLTSPLAFGSSMPVTTDDSAASAFNGTTGISLPDGWTNIRVELDALVSADATTGTSFIQMKDAEISVETAEVPLPAAVLAAPIAAFIGWRARRKFGLAK